MDIPMLIGQLPAYLKPVFLTWQQHHVTPAGG